ncbi:glycosyltransferase [Pseudodonghicola flavimaris]|uniref:Glycosyltransferase n=1 Tax=Pseudodonghicola flavimaris TaxID=3050036 RepID=A0ABT7EXB8_9RHOB|nr:glycosyltransferase [Pseudodonghicola flavimaris]MDK3016925.1 glycosyltransferase [Pseudodonghicola flavimaris]
MELAYLRHLSHESVPLFALVRTTLGCVLLGPDGVAEIAARIDGRLPWGRADLLSRLTRRDGAVRRAESDLRRFALARCRPKRLAAMLARHLPEGFAYLNVGHSNLTALTLRAVRQGGAGRIAVLIHDAIPLEFPQYQRPGVAEEFAGRLQRVRAHADLVIYNSADTRARVEAQMQAWGLLPPALVAHLGVEPAVPGALPTGIDAERPYFVVLGTIEPRKGHDLLLDLWEEMGPQAPGLIICGARGWNNAAVFARLDALPADGPVREMAGLDDAQIAALLQRSCGLLFPSRAEGYGLPPMEAAALGVPVVSSDLPAIREVLGNIPVYLKESDRYQWLSAIESLKTGHKTQQLTVSGADFIPPTWEDHFNLVLRLT